MSSPAQNPGNSSSSNTTLYLKMYLCMNSLHMQPKAFSCIAFQPGMKNIYHLSGNRTAGIHTLITGIAWFPPAHLPQYSSSEPHQVQKYISRKALLHYQQLRDCRNSSSLCIDIMDRKYCSRRVNAITRVKLRSAYRMSDVAPPLTHVIG